MDDIRRFVMMGRGGGRGFSPLSESSRWNAMLEVLQQPNQTQQTVCLADLQEWLSFATEGAIGSFPLEAFVAALFDLLEGKPVASPQHLRGVRSSAVPTSRTGHVLPESTGGIDRSRVYIPSSSTSRGIRATPAYGSSSSSTSQRPGASAPSTQQPNVLVSEGGDSQPDPRTEPRRVSPVADRRKTAGKTDRECVGGAAPVKESTLKEGTPGDHEREEGISDSRNNVGPVETTREAGVLDGGESRDDTTPAPLSRGGGCTTDREGRGARSSSQEGHVDSDPSIRGSGLVSSHGVISLSNSERDRQGGLPSSGPSSFSSSSPASDPPASTEHEEPAEHYGSGGGGGLAYDFEMMGLGLGDAVQGTTLLDGSDEDALVLGVGGGVMVESRGGDEEQLFFLQHHRSPFVMDDEMIEGDAVFQKMLLVANCLFLLLDLLPAHATAVIVKSPRYLRILNSKLTSIEYIDLAEKILQCVDKLSEEQPLNVFLSGALQSCLSFLDFFSLDVQRRTMKSATRLLNAAHAWASSTSPTERTCVRGPNRLGTMSRSSMSTAVAAAGQVSLGSCEGAEAFPVSPPQTGLRRRENGFVDLGESNSTGSGQDVVAASGGEGVTDTASASSLTSTDTALERRGHLAVREGEQALIQKLKHQREELKSLVLPVLPTLSGLLVYDDEALVQYACQCWRSFVDALVALHLRSAAASAPPPPPRSVGQAATSTRTMVPHVSESVSSSSFSVTSLFEQGAPGLFARAAPFSAVRHAPGKAPVSAKDQGPCAAAMPRQSGVEGANPESFQTAARSLPYCSEERYSSGRGGVKGTEAAPLSLFPSSSASATSANEDEEEFGDSRSRWVEEAGERYRQALQHLAADLGEVAGNYGVIGNFMSLIMTHVDACVVVDHAEAGSATVDNGSLLADVIGRGKADESVNKASGALLQPHSCVGEAAYTLAVLANFSGTVTETLLLDPRWTSVEKVMHASGEGEDFMLLLRFVCLGVSLLPAINFNLPLFFRLLHPPRTTSSPKKKKKRPMDAAASGLYKNAPAEGKAAVSSTTHLREHTCPSGEVEELQGRFSTVQGVSASRVLVPEEERTRLLSERPQLFGVLLRTFLSPLLRLYDRALSEELRLETLQFLLSCVVTASVAEGQTKEENNGTVRSAFIPDGSPKKSSRLGDQGVSEGLAAEEEVTKRLNGNKREGSLSEENRNTLRGQLLVHMDAVQVSEFIGYILQTRPSVTAVAAALNVTLELLSLAPRTYLPAFAKEGVLSCIQSQILPEFYPADGVILPSHTAFCCPSPSDRTLFPSFPPQREGSKMGDVPSVSPFPGPPSCAEGNCGLSVSPDWGAAAHLHTREEKEGTGRKVERSRSSQEGPKAADLPFSPPKELLEASILGSLQDSFRWFFAFSSSGHVVVHLSRFCIWLAWRILSIQAGARQASPHISHGVERVDTTADSVEGGGMPCAGGRCSATAEAAKRKESSSNKAGSNRNHLSLLHQSSAVLPRLQQVTALLHSAEVTTNDDFGDLQESEDDGEQVRDSSCLREFDDPVSSTAPECEQSRGPAQKVGMEERLNKSREKASAHGAAPGLPALQQAWRALLSLRRLLEGEHRISAFEFIESDVAAALASFLGGIDFSSSLCPHRRLSRCISAVPSSSESRLKPSESGTPLHAATALTPQPRGREEEKGWVKESELVKEITDECCVADGESGTTVDKACSESDRVKEQGLFFPCGCPACSWERQVGQQFFLEYQEELHCRVCLFLLALAFPSASEDLQALFSPCTEAGGVRAANEHRRVNNSPAGDTSVLEFQKESLDRDEKVRPRGDASDSHGEKGLETEGRERQGIGLGGAPSPKSTRPGHENPAESLGREHAGGIGERLAAMDFWGSIPWGEADGKLLLQLVSLCMKGLSRTADRCFPVGPLFSSSSAGSSSLSSSSLPPHLRPPHPTLAGVVLYRPGKDGVVENDSGRVSDRSVVEGPGRCSARFPSAASHPHAAAGTSFESKVVDGVGRTPKQKGEGKEGSREKEGQAATPTASAASPSKSTENEVDDGESSHGAGLRDARSSLSQENEIPASGNPASSEALKGQHTGDSLRADGARLDEDGQLGETEDGRKRSPHTSTAVGSVLGSKRVQRCAGRGEGETAAVGSAGSAPAEFPQLFYRQSPALSPVFGSSLSSFSFSSHFRGLVGPRRASDVDPLSVFTSLHREVLVRLQPTSEQRMTMVLLGNNVSSQDRRCRVRNVEKPEEHDGDGITRSEKTRACTGGLGEGENKAEERMKAQEEPSGDSEFDGGLKKRKNISATKEKGESGEGVTRSKQEEESHGKDSSCGDCERLRRARGRGGKEISWTKAAAATGSRGTWKSERSGSPALNARAEGDNGRKQHTEITSQNDGQEAADRNSVDSTSRGSRRRGRRTGSEGSAEKSAAELKEETDSGGSNKDATTLLTQGEKHEEKTKKKDGRARRSGRVEEARRRDTVNQLTSPAKEVETSRTGDAAALSSAPSVPQGIASSPSSSSGGATALSAFMRELLSTEPLEEGGRDAELSSASDMLSLLAGSAAAALDDEEDEEDFGDEDDEDEFEEDAEEEEDLFCPVGCSSALPTGAGIAPDAVEATDSTSHSLLQRRQVSSHDGAVGSGEKATDPEASLPVAQTPAISSVSSSSFSSPRIRHARGQSRSANSTSTSTLDRVVAGLREQSQRLLHQSSSAGDDSQALLDLLDRLSSSFLSQASIARGGSRGRVDGTRRRGGGGGPTATGHMGRGAWMTSLFPSFSSRLYRSGGKRAHDGPEFEVMVDGQTQMAKLEACVMRREIAKSSSSHLAHLPKGRRSMVEREEKAQQEAAAEASRAQRGVTESNDAGVRRKTVRQGATSAAEGAAEENKQDKEDDDTGVRREASVKKEAKKEKLQGEGKKRGSVKQERDRDDQRSMSCVDVAEEGKETRVGGEGQGRAVNGRQTKEEHRGFKVREQKQEREKAMSREEKRKRVENEQAQRSRDDHKGVGRGSRRSARLCAHVGERRKAQGKEDENGKASMAGSVLAKETAADVRRREASLYACPDSRASQQRACERRFLWEEAIDGSHQGAEKMKEEEQDVDLLTGVKEVRHEDHGRGRRRGRQRRVEAGDKTADDDSEPPQEVVNDSRLRERGDEEEPGTDEDGVTSPSSSPSCSPEELDEEEEDSEMGGVEVRIGSPPVSSSREAHHITGSSSESRENGTFSWGNAHTSFLTPPGQQLVNGGWRLGSLSVSPITSEVQLFLNTVPVPSHMPLIEALCRYSHCLPVTAGTAERCVSISTPHFSSHVSSSSSFSYPQRARRFSGTAGRQGEGSEGWSARDLTVRRAPSSSCSLGNRRRRALCECEEAEFRRKEAPRSTLGERHSSAAARSCPSSDNTSGETRGMFSLGRSAVEGLEGGRSGGNPAFFRSSSFVVGSRSPCPPPFEDQYAVVDLSARFLVALDNDIAMLPQRSKGGRRCNWDSLSQGTSQLRRPVSAEGASIWFSRGGHTNGWDLLEKSPGEPGGDTSDGGGGGGVKTVSRPSLSVASPDRRNRRSITEETERMILHNGEGPEGDILGFRPVWDVRHSLEYKILRLPPHLQKINNGSGAHLSGTPRGQVPEGRGVFVSCTERAAPRDLVVSSPSLSSSSNGEELEEEQSYLLEGRHSPLLCSVVDPIFGSRNLRRDFLSFVGTRASSHTSPSVCSGSSPLSGQFFSPVLSRPPLPKESGKSDSFGSVGQQDEENNAVTPRPLPPPPNVPAVANQPLRFNQHPESQSPLRRTSCFYTTDATGEAQSPLKRKGDCVFLNRTQTDSLVSSGQANAARLLAAFEEARDRMRFLRGCVSIPSRRDLIWCAGSDEAASLVVRRRSCQPRRVENGEAMRERGSGSCSSLLCPSRSSECDSLPQFSALSGSLGSGAEEREEANGVHVSRGRAENQAQTFRERKVSVVREVALSQKSGQGTASVSPRALNMCRITNNCRSTRSPRPEESVNEKQEEVDGQGYFPFLPDMFTRDRTSSALIFLLLLLHHLIQALRRLQLEGAFVSHSDDSAALAVELTSASPLPSSVAVSKEEERKGGKDPTTASAAGFLFHPDTHSPVSRRFLLHRVSEAQLSTLFTSSALSFKVFQVLADPIRVPSMSPPLWMSRLLKACPFLFPFSARMQFVTHTSLGLSRAICCYSSRVREAAETVLRGGNGTSTGVTQVGNSASGGGSRMVSSAVAGGGGTAGGVGGLQGAGSDTTSRALMTALMGRVFAQSKSSRRQQQDFIADLETAALLPRTKVKIYRTKCIDSAFKVMEHFHSLLYSGGGGGASGYQQQPLLEVEYFGEEGVGSGPTIEFYSEVLEALQTHTAPRLFRDSGSDGCFFPFPHMTDASCLGPSFFRKPSMSPLASSSSSGSAVSPSPSEFLSSSLPPGGHLSSGSAYARASPRSGVSKTEDSRKRSPASVSSPRKQTSSLPGRIEESVRTENPVGAARQPVGDQVTDDGERIDGEELSASSAKGGNRAEARSLSEDLNSSKREQKLRLRSAVMEEGGDVTVGDGRKDRRKLAEDSEETAVGSADGGVHPSDRESVVGGRRTDTTNASTLNRSESSHREVHDDELKKPSAGVSSSALVSAASCLEQKLFLLFKLLGQLAAKALLDGRSHCIDLRLHPSFWRLVLQSETHNCRCLWRGLRRRCLAGQEKFKRTERGEKRRTGAEEKSSISSDQLHQDEYRASHRGCRRFSAYDNGTDDNAGACHSPSVEGTAVRRDRAAAEEAWKSVGEARMQTREKEDGQVPADGVGQAQGNEFCTACLRLRALGLVDLVEVDEQLARGLQHMLKMRSEGSDISQLACVFVLPGTDIELVDNGEDVIVDNTNLDLYIQRVLQVTLYEGVLLQAYAFRFGFSTFVPLSALSQFSPVENAHQLYGSGGRLGDPRFWNLDHLRAHIVPDHGFTAASATYTAFLELLTEFSVEERRSFLRFATGTPVLPHGGFAGLRPLMKVVRKPACEAGSRDGRDHFSSSSPSSSSADSVLPSVMTCTNYIKLPEYSTKSMLRARLVTAMTEGQGAFTLS